ncbi:hypothetical protein B9Z55_023391 [Caenorhabditis nigoni]|uniref:Uncharacterized protein n=1 Tax=Caenorhabditis nigoni TaxID=1611254 RepID=A0A2G5SPE7_9PELO|nr:hypothetical protein B9Z55_023391 [Caenorhabditis nigoni]
MPCFSANNFDVALQKFIKEQQEKEAIVPVTVLFIIYPAVLIIFSIQKLGCQLPRYVENFGQCKTNLA